MPVVEPARRAGAPNTQLPATKPVRSSGSLMSRAPGNPLVTGAVVAVVAVVALYLAVHLVLGLLSSLIPVIIVLAAVYLGFQYWRRSNRR